MKPLVVYCHGYGSSANTDKVKQIAEAGFDAVAFDIDIDPRVSLPKLRLEIDHILVGQYDSPQRLVFVGTSLGGWYANKLARTYGARCIIVNPSYDPGSSLKKFELSDELLSAYVEQGPIDFEPSVPGYAAQLVCAEHDEVLDLSVIQAEAKKHKVPLLIVKGADHRFKAHFKMVLDMI